MTCKMCSCPVLLYVCKVTKDKILCPKQDLPAEQAFPFDPSVCPCMACCYRHTGLLLQECLQGMYLPWTPPGQGVPLTMLAQIRLCFHRQHRASLVLPLHDCAFTIQASLVVDPHGCAVRKQDVKAKLADWLMLQLVDWSGK